MSALPRKTSSAVKQKNAPAAKPVVASAEQKSGGKASQALSQTASEPSPNQGTATEANSDKEIYPGLTPLRLTMLACTLAKQTEQKNSTDLVNQAIDVWNKANEACCDTDEKKTAFLEWKDRNYVATGWISFQELADKGRLSSRKGKATLGSPEGVRKATAGFYNSLISNLPQVLSDRPGDISKVEEALKQQLREVLAKNHFPYCGVKMFKQFQAQNGQLNWDAFEVEQLVGINLGPRLDLEL
jgi:hypothetical protein